MRRHLWKLAVPLVAVVFAAGGSARAVLPGEVELVNFEHVFNFPIPDGDPKNSGTDIEFYTVAERDYAVVGAQGKTPEESRGAWIFDITDPENPSLVSKVPCNQNQNDVQIKRFGERWILGLAADSGLACLKRKVGAGSLGLSLFDITNPATPVPMFSIRHGRGVHNFTFHPTKPFGWISTGDIPGGRNVLPIVDFTDLENPVIVAELQTVGSAHDVVFTEDGSLAYVAIEHHIEVFDSTDPANPVLLSTIVTPTTYHHDAQPSPDGRLMVATGESLVLGGFFAPAAGCPGEGLTLYSIEASKSAPPAPIGEFVAELAGPNLDGRACTAHVGRFTPNSKYYVMGWYIGGVRVVDLTVPSAPREAGRAVMPDTEVWAAKTYKGPYVYTSDQRRGFDVFRWTGPSFDQ